MAPRKRHPLAADYGVTVYSNDTDIARFAGVSVINPIAR